MRQALREGQDRGRRAREARGHREKRARHLRSELIFALVLTSCRTPPATRPADVASIAVAPAPADAGGGAVDDASTPNADVACALEVDKAYVPIALAAEAPVIGHVERAQGRLTFPAGTKDRGALLQHRARGLRLRAVVPSSSLRLYVAKPIALGGFYVPHAYSPVQWVSAEPGVMSVVPVRDPYDTSSVEVTMPSPPEGSIACDGLFLEPPPTFDVLALATGGAKTQETFVRINTTIGLSRTPGERALAELRFTFADEAKVQVVERSGAYSRVVVTAWPSAVLFGWISNAAFAPGPTRPGTHVIKAPRISMGTSLGWNMHDVTCPEPIELHAQMNGERRRIGEIEAGTHFSIVNGEPTDEWTIARVNGIRMEREANLLVSTATIGACH